MDFIQSFAQRLDAAASEATAIPQVSAEQAFTVQQAYEIQKMAIQHRLDRGDALSGLKMGFTSRAKMEQMGVHDMIWGRLTSAMEIQPGQELEMSKLIHPRAEPEICFQVSETIDWEIDLDEARKLVSGVAVAIEVIDSRYKDFKFSLEDVIADNCSSCAYAIGEWYEPDVDLFDLDMTLQIDGEIVQSGSSNAILDNPWDALIAATRLAFEYGQPIPQGSIILAGAATPAAHIQAGQEVKATLQGMGEISFRTS